MQKHLLRSILYVSFSCFITSSNTAVSAITDKKCVEDYSEISEKTALQKAAIVTLKTLCILGFAYCGYKAAYFLMLPYFEQTNIQKISNIQSVIADQIITQEAPVRKSR